MIPPLKFPHRLLAIAAAICLAATSSAVGEEPDLYLLSVGIEPELTAQNKRDWYARDAEYMRKALVGGETFYQTVHSRLLMGNRATRAHVLEGLEWIAGTMTQKDLAIIFFSAHGDVDEDSGYSIDLALVPRGRPGDDSLSGDEINRAMAKIPGKVILMLDTCAAGGVLPRDQAPNPKHAFLLACRADEESDGQWVREDRPHGYFVLAVCEALMGLADTNADGIVDFRELIEYLPARATALYPGQNAVVRFPENFHAIPLARIDARPNLKPLWGEREK